MDVVAGAKRFEKRAFVNFARESAHNGQQDLKNFELDVYIPSCDATADGLDDCINQFSRLFSIHLVRLFAFGVDAVVLTVAIKKFERHEFLQKRGKRIKKVSI